MLRCHPTDDHPGQVVQTSDDPEPGNQAAGGAPRPQVTVRGSIAESVLRLLRERYDDVTTATAGPNTVLTVAGIDQASQRALLALLWDTGHEIESLTFPTTSPQ